MDSGREETRLNGRTIGMTVEMRRAIHRLVHPALGLALFVLLCASAVLAAKELPAPHSVNLNTATLQQLEELPGIGPSHAQKILDYRKKAGSFRSVNDLLVIRGISKRELDKIRPYITVGAPPSHSPAGKPTPKAIPPKTTSPSSGSPPSDK
jgi:competence protein ComEA